MDKKHKRIALLGVSSLLLVAIGALIGNQNTNGHENDKYISISNKAIKKVCQSVDYEEACINSLWSTKHKIEDRKELIKMGFESAIKHMKSAAQKTAVLLKLQHDFRTKGALDSCSELANMAINDIHRTFNKFSDLDIDSINKILDFADLKIWISGAMTYQETCLDGFIKTSGNAGGKMRNALKSGMQLTTNALAMVSEIASAFTRIEMRSSSVKNRHLLLFGGFPDWLDSVRRTMMEANPEKINANLVVAQDGSGDYKTINEALNDIPRNNNNTFVLYIKEGVYNEKVQFNTNLINLMVIGDGPTKTKITGKLNKVDGTPTFHSATVAVNGDYFIAKDIGFENTAGPEKEQAVALRVGADKSIFFNCQIDGYQDTLYAHTYRQFYRDCTISGTIDFVFGDGAAVFQNCTFLIRKPLDNQQNIVTAQGRKNVRQPTGIVLQNCTITADPTLYPVKNTIKSYLGRPWKEYSRTIIMESFIDDVIQPEGYLLWNDTFALETLFYTEFNNRGPGSIKDKRVKWPGIKELTTDRILRFTAGQFIEGNTWIASTNVPYTPALVYSPPEQYPAAISLVSAEENVDLENMKDKQSYVSPKEEALPPFALPPEALPPEAPDYASATVPHEALQPDAPDYAPATAPAPLEQQSFFPFS